MNSLKLLAFGNSLAAGREVVGRFREREDCVLPRFAAGPPVPAGSWWRRWLTRWRSAPPADLESAVSTPAAQVAAAPVESRVSVTEPAVGETLPQAPLPAPLDGPATTHRLVTARQREFRFEHVTVVCNDLHDADLEFVSVKPNDRVRVATEPPQTLAVAGTGA